MKPDRQHPLIRRLATDDLDRLHEVEQLAYPFPWSRRVLSDCLEGGHACFGLQVGHVLAGYSIASIAAGEAHLLNLCMHPDWQHRGYGSLLLEYMINHAVRQGADAMFLEVRASNPRATRLYQNRGFSVIGRRPNYYRAGEAREDAIVMRLPLEPVVD